MHRSLFTLVFALATAGLVATSPAAASPTAASPAAASPSAASPAGIPAGTGYVVAPAAFRSARVSVKIPKLHCSAGSPKRVVRLGIFATSTSSAHPAPADVISLVVRASCETGRSRYAVVYRNNGRPSTELGVRPGQVYRLVLNGASSFAVNERDGSDSGGGYGSSHGHKLTVGRHVLIGARIIGPAPHDVDTLFTKAIVNRTPLGQVAHHVQAGSRTVRVGPLKHSGDFDIRLT